MANTDSATGFFYDVYYADESPPIHAYEQAESTTLNPGDAVTLTAGKLTIAASGDPVLGVVLGLAAQDGEVYDNAGPIVAGAGEFPMVSVILAFAQTVFRVHDANATPTDALVGASVDIVGTTGVQGVNSSVVINGDVMLFDIAGADSISGNAYGADMQWLCIFQNRFIL